MAGLSLVNPHIHKIVGYDTLRPVNSALQQIALQKSNGNSGGRMAAHASNQRVFPAQTTTSKRHNFYSAIF